MQMTSKPKESNQSNGKDFTPLTTEAKAIQELLNEGEYTQLVEQHGLDRLPRVASAVVQKAEELTTTGIMDLLKTKSNNRKFGRQFAGQTPNWSQKNPTEERDVESWGEARQRKTENREWGLPEENDMSDPAASDPNVAKPSRSKFLVNPVQLAAEEEPIRESDKKLRDQVAASRADFINRIRPGKTDEKPMTRSEWLEHRRKNPGPEIALEYLEKEGTGGHGVGDGAGAQVANGGAGLASGGTAHVSTSAGIFTPTHGGDRGKKIKKPNDSSHTVNLDNFNTRGTQIAALTSYVKKQFLDKAKAPYYNRDVQALDTSTIRDQKSQKKQSKQDNMAGNKRNIIWRNP